MSVKWTEEVIEQAKEILGRHETVSEAIHDLRMKLEFMVTKNSLELAFYRNGLDGPVNYLKEPDFEEDNCETVDRATSQIVKLIKSEKYNFEDLCNKLDLSPKKCETKLKELKESYGFDVSIGPKIKFELKESLDSVHQINNKVKITDKWKALLAFISDTHWGSEQTASPELRAFIEYAYSLGVRDIGHSGDLGDGLYHKGQEFELIRPEMHHHIDLALEDMVQLPGLKYHLITGNHDRNGYFKKCGLDFGVALEDRARSLGREDIKYYGYSRARLKFGSGGDAIKVELAHPEGGSAYAKSYPVQKYIERGYAGGDKPTIAVLGHLHTYSIFDVRNVLAIQPACFQWTTQFLRSKGLNSTVGGVIVEVAKDDVGIKFRHEFVKFWPKEQEWEPV